MYRYLHIALIWLSNRPGVLRFGAIKVEYSRVYGKFHWMQRYSVVFGMH